MTYQLASLAGRDYFYLDAFWHVNLGMYIITWDTIMHGCDKSVIEGSRGCLQQKHFQVKNNEGYSLWLSPHVGDRFFSTLRRDTIVDKNIDFALTLVWHAALVE